MWPLFGGVFYRLGLPFVPAGVRMMAFYGAEFIVVYHVS